MTDFELTKNFMLNLTNLFRLKMDYFNIGLLHKNLQLFQSTTNIYFYKNIIHMSRDAAFNQ